MQILRKTVSIFSATALALGAAVPAFADVPEPSAGESTGSGTTELRIIADTSEYGGTEDPANPADENGLGSNLAFTVPSAINYIVKADGSLLAPDSSVVYIENKSAFDIHVSSMEAQEQSPWKFTDDARTSSESNAVDLRIGPLGNLQQVSEFISNKQEVTGGNAWCMSAAGAGDAAKLHLASQGHANNITQDLSSANKIGTLHWYLASGGRKLVSFDSNAGLKAVHNMPLSISFPDLGEDLPSTAGIPDEVPERAGYTFEGWSENPEATVAGYQPGETVSIPQDGEETTLYAVWKEKKYSVKFKSYVDLPADQAARYRNVPVGSESEQDVFELSFDWDQDLVSVDPEANGLSRVGRRLTGWYTDDGRLVAPEETFEVLSGGDENAEITLHARWAYKTYTVKYDSNGGSEVEDNVFAWNENGAAAPEPTRTGYVFAGWFTDAPDAFLVVYANTIGEAFDGIDSNDVLNLTASWHAKSLKVHYDANGGSVHETECTFAWDQPNIVPANAERSGYTFEGWWTTPDKGGFKVEHNMTLADVAGNDDESDIELFARWSPGPASISFYKNSGRTWVEMPEDIAEEDGYKVGDTITISFIPERAGYTFLGWSLDNRTIVCEPGGSWTISTSPATLYAMWQAN